MVTIEVRFEDGNSFRTKVEFAGSNAFTEYLAFDRYPRAFEIVVVD